MVSLWWVTAAFFVGGYAGALLVAVMSMARDETAMPRNSVGAARRDEHEGGRSGA